MPLTNEDRAAVRHCFQRYAETQGFDSSSEKYIAFIFIINTAVEDIQSPFLQEQYSHVETVLDLLDAQEGENGAFSYLKKWYAAVNPEPLADCLAVRFLGELSPERVRDLAQHDEETRRVAIGALSGVQNLAPEVKDEVVEYAADACKRNASIIVKYAEKGGAVAVNQCMVRFLQMLGGKKPWLPIFFKHSDVHITVTFLMYETVQAINQWYLGKISGLCAATDVARSVLGAFSGYACATLGTMVGHSGGPSGMIIGGVLGGIAGGLVGQALVDELCSTFFKLPKDKAVENAYITLGVPFNASADQINTAYRALALFYHPDRPGGNEVRFKKVCAAVELIRLHVRNGSVGELTYPIAGV